MTAPKAITKSTRSASSLLKLQIKEETEKRKLLTEFIGNHLVDGVDYGKIHIMPKSKCPSPYDCKIEYHYSKNTLFKSGSEKFMSLFHLRAAFRKDTDTWEMFGNTNGTICYICELIGPNGTVVGEGRGSATLGEEQTSNKVVKLAAKRAQMDAILRTGGLSDYFTQDLEDASQIEPKVVNQEGKKINYATPKQIDFLKALIRLKGKTEKEILEYYKVDSFEKIPFENTSNMIKKLQSLSNSGIAPSKPIAPMPEKKENIVEELKGAKPVEEKAEEKKEDNPPAANFEVAWIKVRFSKLLEAKILKIEDRDNLEFISHKEYLAIKDKYNAKYGNQG